MVDADSYSAPEACQMAGVSYRQLDWWSRTGTCCADVAEADGSGTARRYSVERVRCLALAGRLAALGARRTVIAAAVRRLVEEPSLWSCVAVIDPDGDVVSRRDWHGVGGWQVDLRDITREVFGARPVIRP